MREMLEEKLARCEFLEKQLADPEVLSNAHKMASIAREHGSLSKISAKFRTFKDIQKQIQEAKELLESGDSDMIELAEAELPELRSKVERIWQGLLDMTIGGEDATRTRCVLEMRAGTGGDEAALFAGNLFTIYNKHCEV